jgi:GNAT superfamily N-acetyltransferase
MKNPVHKIEVRPVKTSDLNWMVSLLTKRWGSYLVVSKGKLSDARRLPGFIAINENKRSGLLTYKITGNECEIISLDSLRQGTGIGTQLINEIIKECRKLKLKRIWLITTNNNDNALRFYKNRGFILKAVYPNAVEISRKLKPQIPLADEHGIPIRDEIELEMQLD